MEVYGDAVFKILNLVARKVYIRDPTLWPIAGASEAETMSA